MSKSHRTVPRFLHGRRYDVLPEVFDFARHVIACSDNQPEQEVWLRQMAAPKNSDPLSCTLRRVLKERGRQAGA
jgi:hypothetical protein